MILCIWGLVIAGIVLSWAGFRWQSRNEIVAFVVGMACLIAAVVYGLLMFPKAQAHDHARPELNAWMSKLKSQKGLCCSGEDGTALADPDWQAQDKENSHYRVKIDNEWWDVPDEAVVNEPNKAEHAVVWPMRFYAIGGKLNIEIRCFMPGTMT